MFYLEVLKQKQSNVKLATNITTNILLFNRNSADNIMLLPKGINKN